MMKHASFRFYAELNDLLPPAERQQDLVRSFPGSPSVKDLIESCGVPHTEIDIVLVNGVSVGFDHHIEDGDRVSIYPVFEAFDITPVVRLRPRPLRESRFVLDVHLGKLARRLRLLGFDSAWNRFASDESLVADSLRERRILLTRDRGILKRRDVTHGAFVHETDPRRQLIEIVDRFDLVRSAAPFTRCITCNGQLVAVQKGEILDLLPPRTRLAYDEFHRCAACGRILWWGPHTRRLREIVNEVLG